MLLKLTNQNKQQSGTKQSDKKPKTSESVYDRVGVTLAPDNFFGFEA